MSKWYEWLWPSTSQTPTTPPSSPQQFTFDEIIDNEDLLADQVLLYRPGDTAAVRLRTAIERKFGVPICLH
jgi:hypothetical protein